MGTNLFKYFTLCGQSDHLDLDGSLSSESLLNSDIPSLKPAATNLSGYRSQSSIMSNSNLLTFKKTTPLVLLARSSPTLLLRYGIIFCVALSASSSVITYVPTSVSCWFWVVAQALSHLGFLYMLVSSYIASQRTDAGGSGRSRKIFRNNRHAIILKIYLIFLAILGSLLQGLKV